MSRFQVAVVVACSVCLIACGSRTNTGTHEKPGNPNNNRCGGSDCIGDSEWHKQGPNPCPCPSDRSEAHVETQVPVEPDAAPPQPVAPPTPQTEAKRLYSKYGCMYSAAEEKACKARGSGFEYGPLRDIKCHGNVQPDHGEPYGVQCSCNDKVAIAARLQQCSRVP